MSQKLELIDLIKDNETIQRYKKIEVVINKDKKLKAKINQLKTVQKQLINAKEINKVKAIEKFQSEYDVLLEEIETYPLMTEYLDLQEEINQMLKDVLKIIEDKINKEIENSWKKPFKAKSSEKICNILTFIVKLN